MDALLAVDMQNDFMPWGRLPVANADKLIPVINKLMTAFDLVIATQDWHPANHGSFASNHPGCQPGDKIQLKGIEQILWPDHCVQNTGGALFAPTLDTRQITIVTHKGTDPDIDSYSAFFDNGHVKSTGLDQVLKRFGVTDLYLCGVATDFCVKFSALDALSLQLKTYLVTDACRGVNLQPTDSEAALQEVEQQGAILVNASDLRL